MPLYGTQRQKEVFDKLTKYLEKKGYEYFGYIPNGDCYKFGKPICCYIQYISTKAYKHPKESLKVIIYQNQKNKNMRKFMIGNDGYGYVTRHVFVIPGDLESYNLALRLIDTI